MERSERSLSPASPPPERRPGLRRPPTTPQAPAPPGSTAPPCSPTTPASAPLDIVDYSFSPSPDPAGGDLGCVRGDESRQQLPDSTKKTFMEALLSPAKQAPVPVKTPLLSPGKRAPAPVTLSQEGKIPLGWAAAAGAAPAGERAATSTASGLPSTPVRGPTGGEPPQITFNFRGSTFVQALIRNLRHV